MPPTINISDKDYQALKQLGIRHKVVEPAELAESRTAPQQTPEPPSINYEPNPSDYVFVPGIKTGKEKRPDLWVCKYRLGMSPEVEQAGKSLSLQLENTAKEKNGKDYIGNINREQAIRLNLLLGGRTSNLRLTKDFLKLLFSGKALDGNRKNIRDSELANIANEITELRAPYRAEWFEDYFTTQGDELILNKNYVLSGDVLVPEYSNPLTTCLMEDRLPGIDLQDWLTKSTAQGLPRKNIKQAKLWYWYPRENGASRFVANPDDADLDCYGDPLISNSRLGVRHVREARNFSKKQLLIK